MSLLMKLAEMLWPMSDKYNAVQINNEKMALLSTTFIKNSIAIHHKKMGLGEKMFQL